MKRSATVRLLFFVLAVLLVPMALNHVLPAKTRFNRQPLERLRAARPSVILIGDSLVHAAVDPQLLQKELGAGEVEMIWRGGAASAAWYLSLKNYVAASGVRPRLCCIFFTYDLLTNAAFRTTATYRSFLESLMHENEPVFFFFLGEQTARESKQRRRHFIHTTFGPELSRATHLHGIFERLPGQSARNQARHRHRVTAHIQDAAAAQGWIERSTR